MLWLLSTVAAAGPLTVPAGVYTFADREAYVGGFTVLYGVDDARVDPTIYDALFGWSISC